MMHDWHEFYSLLGAAAATLVALLFVAVAIGVGILSSARASGTRIYMSPIILHYASVLFISLLVLVPTLHDGELAVLIGTCCLIGVGYSGFVCARLVRDPKVETVDHFGYGAGPLLAYLGAVVAAYLMISHIKYGPELLAASLLLLLFVNIRNAWDLAVTMARWHGDNGPPGSAS